MEESIRRRLEEIAASGDAGGAPEWVPLGELPSGARFGLSTAGQWVLVPGDEDRLPRPFDGPERGRFFECIEIPRSDFDQQLTAAAAELGLPAEWLVASFPAVELVRDVLALRTPYYLRLGLLWLLPSEMRELRDPIEAVARDGNLPQPVRALARRVTVPA